MQVLNEFAVVTHRKMKMSRAEIGSASQALRTVLQVSPITSATHEAALSLAEQHDFAFCDALIVASALEAKCTTLFSEDMQHGMTVRGSLRIVNPFLESATGPTSA